MKPTLTYFQTCTEDQHEWQRGEFSQSFQWLEHPIQVGDLVSMGDEKRFKVIELERFEPIDLNQPLTAIIFARVCLDDRPMPDRENWEFSQSAGEYPYGIVNSLDLPIQEGMHTSDQPFTLPYLQNVRYDCYKPIAENASYPAIHLAWCHASVLQVA